MTYKKLSEPEKQQILQLYQAEAETIPSLSERFGVSSTTIRRLLKSAPASVSAPAELPEPEPPVIPTLPPDDTQPRRSRRRSSSTQSPQTSRLDEESIQPATVVSEPPLTPPEIRTSPSPPILKKQTAPPVTATVSLGEELVDFVPDQDDLEVDESDLDDDDLEGDELRDEDLEEDFEEDAEEGESVWQKPQLQADGLVHVLPISEASLPKICYLVVDRMAELITRPLKDFGDLGQFPEEEVQQKTLPVFDNHHIARRFSNRTQRVVKVPNGSILQTTSPHLHAKGITRLLVNGRVYSLEATEV